MRPAAWLRLFAVFALAGLLTPAALAGNRQNGLQKKPVLKEEFTGYGKTVKDAEAHALEQAHAWMAQHANFGWTPSAEYLRERGLVRFGDPTEEEFEKAGLMKVVKGDLEVTPEQAREIQQHARQERMSSRHLLLAKVLGGLVCLLLVVGGYLRLEEATRGYYTRALRLGALGILAVVLLGLLVVG
jgi:hypothetical protein